jgi:hypothetical protein
MSQEFVGFVVKISERSGKGSRPPYRPWTAYSCKLEREDGSEYEGWLSLGFDPPPFKEGDYVKMSGDKDDKGYLKIDPNSIQVKKNPPARAKKGDGNYSATSSRTGSGETGARKGGVDWNSAVARATDVVAVLLANDALPISSTKTKAGQASRYEEVIAFVDKLSVKFYNDNQTMRLLETVSDTVTNSKPDGELPEADEGQTDTTEEGEGDEWK